MTRERWIDLDAARAAAARYLPDAPDEPIAPGADAQPEPEPSEPQPSAEEVRAQRAQFHAAIRILLDKLTRTAAARFGDHWLMDESEANAIALPLTEIVERDLGLLGDTPEDRLLLAVGIYAVPRVLVSMSRSTTSPATSSATLDVRGETVP